MDLFTQCASIIGKSQKIMFLTGAGMSTESGIPDFRSGTGLYQGQFHGLKPETILSLSFFKQNPSVFWDYIAQYLNCDSAKPNIGHQIIAKWEETKNITVVTQNIDQLHSMAGSKNVIEVHGNIKSCTCIGCGKKYELNDVLSNEEGYRCSCRSLIKPDIVLYEESVNKMSEVYPLLPSTDLLIVLGTSLTVYPVAMIPELYNRRAKYMIIINKTATPYYNENNIIEIHESIGDTLKKIDYLLNYQ